MGTLCLQPNCEYLGYILQIWLNYNRFPLLDLTNQAVSVDDASVWLLGYAGCGWGVILIHFTICKFVWLGKKSYGWKKKIVVKKHISLRFGINYYQPLKKKCENPRRYRVSRVFYLVFTRIGWNWLDCSNKTRLYNYFWSFPTHWRIQEYWRIAALTPFESPKNREKCDETKQNRGKLSMFYAYFFKRVNKQQILTSPPLPSLSPHLSLKKFWIRACYPQQTSNKWFT